MNYEPYFLFKFKKKKDFLENPTYPDSRQGRKMSFVNKCSKSDDGHWELQWKYLYTWTWTWNMQTVNLWKKTVNDWKINWTSIQTWNLLLS